MSAVSRRHFLAAGGSIAVVSLLGIYGAQAQSTGFTAASSSNDAASKPLHAGLNAIWAVTEVTGGGQKMERV